MRATTPSARNLFALGLLLFVCLSTRSDTPAKPLAGMAALPRVTLWVWERREDLRGIDPARYAIAELDQTLTIDLNVHSQPRWNPIALPAGVTRIAVVRIEPSRYAVLDEEARRQAVAALLRSARQPGISALQIDFDATVSQRAFYRSLLEDLRRQMPSGLPLSITALASWCSWDGWLRGLPIDEAVPMFFRMEPDRRRAPASTASFQIREPLCMGSVGVSTNEPWPANFGAKRMYVFPDRGWSTDALSHLEDQLP